MKFLNSIDGPANRINVYAWLFMFPNTGLMGCGVCIQFKIYQIHLGAMPCQQVIPGSLHCRVPAFCSLIYHPFNTLMPEKNVRHSIEDIGKLRIFFREIFGILIAQRASNAEKCFHLMTSSWLCYSSLDESELYVSILTDTWRNDTVIIASKTTPRRRFDVIMTLLLRLVSAGYVPRIGRVTLHYHNTEHIICPIS